jgi:hypothetical protein
MKRFKPAFNKSLALWEARDAAREYVRQHGSLKPRDALRATCGTHWNAFARLDLIDALTLCHGVESFKSVNGFWSYANTGDTYCETVLLSPGGRFIVASYGDILEQRSHWEWNERKERR